LLSIVGNGMGEYNFSNLPKEINLSDFDFIVCDKNFKEEGKNIYKFSYKEAKKFILENYKTKNILYVVTGSPTFFSAATIIAKNIPKKYLTIYPATSSKEYLLAKLAISESEVEVISLHGRKNIDLEKFLKKRFTFILTDQNSLKRLLEALKYIPSKNLRWIIGYKMGYKDEFIGEFDPKKNNFNLLEPHVILLERLFEYPKRLFDEDFKTQRGVITKKYKRDFCLELLELSDNQIFWDIGAGSGSCAIEAFIKYRVKTFLFEKDQERTSFIEENLKRHNVFEATLFKEDALKAIKKIENNPDRILIGGGGVKLLEELEYLINRLKKDGILIILAVTLNTLSKAVETLEKSSFWYEVISLDLTTWNKESKIANSQRKLFLIKIKNNQS